MPPIFIDPTHRRLRALWRLLVHSLLLVVFGFSSWLLVSVAVPEPPQWAFGLVMALGVLLPATFICGIRLDRREFADFGFHIDRRWWSDFVFGLALGACLLGAVFLLEWQLGWLEIRAVAFAPGPLIGPLVFFVGVGFYEELMSRGYHLRNLAEGVVWGRLIDARAALIIATLVSSTTFGVLHANNPNATLLSTFNIAVAGVFLAIGVLLTGELAMPIGIHITWNFFQGNVFGFPVSGSSSGATIFTIDQGGDPLLTGGEFGPEAGLLGLGSMVLGTLLILAWVRLTRGRLALRLDLAHYRAPPP